MCNDDLSGCQASEGGRFIDNGDGMVTDNQWWLMWEKKLAADGSDGGNCTDAAQADRSVHCVNKTYIWSAGGGGGTAADGTLFTVFLHTLNNKCDGDETTQCDGDADCAVANGGPGGPCTYSSAITNTWAPTNAWLVNFANGVVFDFPFSKILNFHARAVRSCPWLVIWSFDPHPYPPP